MATDYETLVVERDGPITVITFNRPEVMNALNWQMGLELRHSVHHADQDEDCRVIVVTGRGRAFCAGQDMSTGTSAFRRGDTPDEDLRTRITEELTVRDARQYWEMNTPIIAAINGAAVGAGITIPLQFDLRVVAEDAKLGFVFARRGVLPELNATMTLPLMTGIPRALELLMTGRIFSGRDAVAYGLANEALPAEQVLPRAMELAREIAVNAAPLPVALVKRLVWENAALGTTLADVQRRNSQLFRWTTQQPDAQEGPASFLQKRDPNWSARKYADFPHEVFAGAGRAG